MRAHVAMMALNPEPKPVVLAELRPRARVRAASVQDFLARRHVLPSVRSCLKLCTWRDVLQLCEYAVLRYGCEKARGKRRFKP